MELIKNKNITFSINKNDKISNFIRKYGYSSSEDLFLDYYNTKPPLCKCGNVRKYISFHRGYYKYCYPKKHNDEIKQNSVKARTKTVTKYLEDIDGYDEFVLNNLETYLNPLPFTDPFDNRRVTTHEQIIRKSKSNLQKFDDPRVCYICNKLYDYNPIIYDREICRSKSCIGIHRNYPNLKSLLQEYRVGIEIFFQLIKGRRFPTEKDTRGVLEAHNKITNLGLNTRDAYDYLNNRLVIFEDKYVLRRHQSNHNYSFIGNNYPHKATYRSCAICDSSYIYADLIYDEVKNETYENVISAEYTCSSGCYDKIRGNKEYYSNYLEVHKNQSIWLKNRIKEGKFTPAVTNSWGNTRVIIDEISFRSSWEAYFYLFATYVIGDSINFEKLRISYYDPNTEKDRIYIVDFIDYNKKIVYEIKPY